MKQSELNKFNYSGSTCIGFHVALEGYDFIFSRKIHEEEQNTFNGAPTGPIWAVKCISLELMPVIIFEAPKDNYPLNKVAEMGLYNFCSAIRDVQSSLDDIAREINIKIMRDATNER